MSETFNRSQLDGKDRDELSQIASALGVKATSRMRKADLVDAIVGAAAGGDSPNSAPNGAGRATPRKIRSSRAVDDDIATIAEEQNSLADPGGSDDDMTLIRPGRRTATGNGDSNGRSPVASDFATTTTVDEPPAGRPASARDTTNERSADERSANERSTAPASESDAPQDRDAPDHADSADHADHDGDGDSGSGDRNGSPQQWRDDDSSANKRR